MEQTSLMPERVANSLRQVADAANMFDGVRVFEITKDDDAHQPATIMWVSRMIDQYPGISLHGSLPCTVWSQLQNMSLYKHGKRYANPLALARRESRSLLKSFLALADKALCQGGH
eukprot:10512567-Karenia_brevis.AAC.1